MGEAGDERQVGPIGGYVSDIRNDRSQSTGSRAHHSAACPMYIQKYRSGESGVSFPTPQAIRITFKSHQKEHGAAQ